MAFGEQGKDVTVSLVKPVDEGRSLAQHQAIDDEVEITCFTEDVHDVTLHFQIIRLRKQVMILPNFECIGTHCRLLLVWIIWKICIC